LKQSSVTADENGTKSEWWFCSEHSKDGFTVIEWPSKTVLPFITICKRTNLSNFIITSKYTLFMLMRGDVHPHPGPSTVKRIPRCLCNVGL
jgi:hypothetical protein